MSNRVSPARILWVGKKKRTDKVVPVDYRNEFSK
jgi:hypothetical protein